MLLSRFLLGNNRVKSEIALCRERRWVMANLVTSINNINQQQRLISISIKTEIERGGFLMIYKLKLVAVKFSLKLLFWSVADDNFSLLY